MITEK